MVQEIVELGGGILWRPREGEEIPDIAVARWARASLLDGYLKDRGDMGDPAFQPRGGELQTVRQGKRLVYGRSVMEK